MVTSIEIGYITKAPDNKMIKEIGGKHPDGTPWKLSAERAIRAIETGEWAFHITLNGINEKVTVKKGRDGFKQLKTVSDGKEENSLLLLPGA